MTLRANSEKAVVGVVKSLSGVVLVRREGAAYVERLEEGDLLYLGDQVDLRFGTIEGLQTSNGQTLTDEFHHEQIQRILRGLLYPQFQTLDPQVLLEQAAQEHSIFDQPLIPETLEKSLEEQQPQGDSGQTQTLILQLKRTESFTFQDLQQQLIDYFQSLELVSRTNDLLLQERLKTFDDFLFISQHLIYDVKNNTLIYISKDKNAPIIVIHNKNVSKFNFSEKHFSELYGSYLLEDYFSDKIGSQ